MANVPTNTNTNVNTTSSVKKAAKPASTDKEILAAAKKLKVETEPMVDVRVPAKFGGGGFPVTINDVSFWFEPGVVTKVPQSVAEVANTYIYANE